MMYEYKIIPKVDMAYRLRKDAFRLYVNERFIIEGDFHDICGLIEQITDVHCETLRAMQERGIIS